MLRFSRPWDGPRPLVLELLILIAVFATSLLSGVLGMAGGMILMAVLVSTLSVGTAMILHGAVQATSNGSRAWFLRQHIQWRILPPYALGALAVLALFAGLTLVPDANLVLLLVGLFPWLARLVPRLNGLDVTRPGTALCCGVVVTAAQLFAGASGPLLDVFYLKSPLNRFQIIASKAFTQTAGHLLKLLYYGLIIGVTDSLPAWLYLAAITVAVLGTRVGTRLLGRLSDERFRSVSGVIILAIAAICALKGAQGLWETSFG
jgi:uncharacterized membrane protein YfcA